MLWRSCLAALMVGGTIACSAADDPAAADEGGGPLTGGTGGQGGVLPLADANTGGASGVLAGAGGGTAGSGGTDANTTGGAGGDTATGGAGGSGAVSGAGGGDAAIDTSSASGSGGSSSEGGVSTDSGGDTGGVSVVGWNLVWSDEFDGPNLDKTAWTASDLAVPWNDELEYYSPNNVTFENGALVLEAREEKFGGRDYTSGKIDTQGKKTWTYGLFVARIKLPATVAMWPAFWLLGVGSWPAAGELDVMESKGRLPKEIGGTAHWSDGGHQWSSANYNFPAGQDITGWHEYALEWSAQQIKWSVDGNVFKTFPWQKPFDNKFYLLLNLAIGGMFDGGRTPPADMAPQRMYVDYVRVYQKP